MATGWRRCLVFAALITLSIPAQDGTASRSAEKPGTSAGGWTEFRGDPLNAGVSFGRAPALSAIRWRFVADSEIVNSPAVHRGMVFFGTRGGFLYALSAATGAKVWERRVSVPPEEGAPSGFTYSNALVVRDRLVIGSEDGHLYCVMASTGELAWKRHLGGVGDKARIWASPKSDGRRVFIGSPAGHFFAFLVEDGAEAWKAWIADEVMGSAAILGGDVIVAARDKRLYVFDAATGASRGRCDLGAATMSTPAVALGCAFLRVNGGRLTCVDLVTRTVRWTTDIAPTSQSQTAPAHDGTTAFVTNAGVLAAIDVDGGILWQARAKKAIYTSPIVVGSLVLIGDGDQALAAYERKSGRLVGEISLGETIIGTPTVVDGVVYAPGQSGILFAVE